MRRVKTYKNNRDLPLDLLTPRQEEALDTGIYAARDERPGDQEKIAASKEDAAIERRGLRKLGKEGRI